MDWYIATGVEAGIGRSSGSSKTRWHWCLTNAGRADAVVAEACSLFAISAEPVEKLLSKRMSIRLLLNISRTLCERLCTADEVLAGVL